MKVSKCVFNSTVLGPECVCACFCLLMDCKYMVSHRAVTTLLSCNFLRIWMCVYIFFFSFSETGTNKKTFLSPHVRVRVTFPRVPCLSFFFSVRSLIFDCYTQKKKHTHTRECACLRDTHMFKNESTYFTGLLMYVCVYHTKCAFTCISR